METKPRPADFLSDVLIPATGRSDGEIARLLGMSLAAFHTILTGEKPITAPTAKLLGRLFHTGADFWLKMQAEYDSSVAAGIIDGRPDEVEPLAPSVKRKRPQLEPPATECKAPLNGGPGAPGSADYTTRKHRQAS